MSDIDVKAYLHEEWMRLSAAVEAWDRVYQNTGRDIAKDELILAQQRLDRFNQFKLTILCLLDISSNND